jgi:hypothetical protein
MTRILALLLLAPLAHAHPGHGAPEAHFHGLSAELILLAALVGAWAIVRSKS